MSKVTLLLTMLVAVVAFLFGAYLRPSALDFTQPGFMKAPDPPVGRFTIVISPLVKNERFLLDTQTGKIWQLAKSGDLSDHSFVCHGITVTDDVDHPHNAVYRSKIIHSTADKSKLGLKAIGQKSADRRKVLNEKSLTEIVPGDSVTIEVITNGKVSKEKVPRANTLRTNMPRQQVLSKNALSVKTASQTSL